MTVTTRKRLSREASRALTREQLLGAARELFARHSFEGTSIDQIAEAAGYSRGAFYSNFPDKEALLIALIERCIDDDMREFAALAAAPQGIELEAGFQNSAERDGADSTGHLLKMEFWMCALRYPQVREVYAQQADRLRHALAALIEGALQARGLTSPLPGDQLAAIVIACRNGLDTQTLIDPSALPSNLYATTMQLLTLGAAQLQAIVTPHPAIKE